LDLAVETLFLETEEGFWIRADDGVAALSDQFQESIGSGGDVPAPA